MKDKGKIRSATARNV